MSPLKVNKEVKKEVILRAAIEVFAKNGLKNTKIIEVANKAGVGKGTVYEYFSSKEEIFETAFEYSMKKVIEKLQLSAQENITPDERLKKMIKGFSSMVDADRTFIEITFHFWAEGVRSGNKILNKKIEKVYTDSKKIISSVLEEGIRSRIFKKIDTEVYASIIVALFDGLLLQGMYNKEFSFEKFASELENILLNQIKK